MTLPNSDKNQSLDNIDEYYKITNVNDEKTSDADIKKSMPAWKKLMMVILLGPKGSIIVGYAFIRKFFPGFTVS